MASFYTYSKIKYKRQNENSMKQHFLFSPSFYIRICSGTNECCWVDCWGTNECCWVVLAPNNKANQNQSAPQKICKRQEQQMC